MKKRFGKLFLFLMAVFIFHQPAARADLIGIKSKVLDINTSSNYLKVEYLDPASQEMQEIKIDIEKSTHFEIYTSLQDVKVGDDVSIEADFNAFSHEWKALWIGPYNENSAQKILQTSAQKTPEPNVPA